MPGCSRKLAGRYTGESNSTRTPNCSMSIATDRATCAWSMVCLIKQNIVGTPPCRLVIFGDSFKAVPDD